MSSASVTIRVDSETKAEAARITEDFGLDLSGVTRAFYRQIVREQRIPLSFEYPRPNIESLDSIAQADEIIKSGSSRYRNADEMFAELDA